MTKYNNSFKIPITVWKGIITMAKKQFKAESKKLLDMMINSIYTHKEIFLRELISNASDAIDKLYYRSLTDDSVALSREDYEIRITADERERTLTISDNGCGMSREDLESNLGTIAKSGSYDFKNADDGDENREKVDIIGQFGVGFYSAFMVSEKITVLTRPFGEQTAFLWESSGVDGYTIKDSEKDTFGTVITLTLKEDSEDEKYSEFLSEYKIRELVKKYSDYIRYPIRMLTSHEVPVEGKEGEFETQMEDETLNSMIPIWKKPQSQVTEEQYADFYREKFYDFEAPLKTIRQKAEGASNYETLMFIPAHAPYDYYSKEFEKGLQLYSSGVLIMERCADLVPDHFSFVRGLVDSADLSLNISREMLQHDRQLRVIAKAVEKKIAGELKKMLEGDRENYEKFWSAFGLQIKYGLYAEFGCHKDTLKDLVMFTSSNEKKNVTLAEYVSRMKEDQKKIYFASGETADKIVMLPQVEAVMGRGYEVLCLTDDVDEFALQMLRSYDSKDFANVLSEELDLSTEEEKEALARENEKAADMLNFIREAVGDAVSAVKLTNTLGEHPVCLSTEGMLSMEMEKVLSKMPGANPNMKAETVLEINTAHPIAGKLAELFASDKDKLTKYSKLLYAQARLISGLSVENPAEIGKMVVELMI